MPCVDQLGELQGSADRIRRAGAEIIAIAARNEADVERTRAALRLDYVLVPGPVPDLYRKYGVANPANERVPMPSTFIIDRQGVVRWLHVGRDDRDRVRAATVLEELARLR